MEVTEIANVLKTPVFWFVSAVGSVALGILGNLLTPKIAEFIASRNTNKREAEDRKKAQFLGEVLIRVLKPERILHAKLDSMYSFLLACTFMLLSLLLFTAANAFEWLLIPEFVRVIISILAIPVVWLSFFLTEEGLKWWRIARFAEKRIDTEDKLSGEPELIALRMDTWDKENFGITKDEAKRIMEERVAAKAQRT